MKDKIIFWLDADLTTFGLAKYLQEKLNDNFFAIVDITDKPKNFFSQQQTVIFQKLWFYHDYIKPNVDADLNYLEQFEKKYNVHLWEFIVNDRIFYNYNTYHKFSNEEMLSIITQECKLFESIIDEINPTFFITHETAFQHHHLFHKMCLQQGVKVLMLNHANYQSKCYISQDRHKFDSIASFNKIQTTGKSINELQKELEDKPISAKLQNLHSNIRNSKIKKIKAAMEFLLFSNNGNQKTHYTYFGRTKIRVLFNEIIYSLKKRYREGFINSHLVRQIDTTKPFVYLPLHQEPERSLLIAAPLYTNQIETIRHIVKSLPIGFRLYVKEHPTQGPARGWRTISAYKEILKIPNVTLIHPSFPSKELIKNCSLVITVGGTSCFEAAFYQKPSIMFADLDYKLLPSVHKLNFLEELSSVIKNSLEKREFDVSALEKYVQMINQNSFDFDYLGFELEYHRWFYYGGQLLDVDIPIQKMKLFLEEQKPILEKLAAEYIKKIEQHKMEKIEKQREYS